MFWAIWFRYLIWPAFQADRSSRIPCRQLLLRNSWACFPVFRSCVFNHPTLFLNSSPCPVPQWVCSSFGPVPAFCVPKIVTSWCTCTDDKGFWWKNKLPILLKNKNTPKIKHPKYLYMVVLGNEQVSFYQHIIFLTAISLYFCKSSLFSSFSRSILSCMSLNSSLSKVETNKSCIVCVFQSIVSIIDVIKRN